MRAFAREYSDGSDRQLAGYQNFLDAKSQLDGEFGFSPNWIPDFLFDFQKKLVEWSVRKGRAAIFADCGLGKTAMELVWAQNVARETNRPVLILTPLAVAAQMIDEAAKFGVEARISRDGSITSGINIANYERLHLFDPDSISGVVCDESSILKGFDGVRRAMITDFMRKMPHRLLATATAAPNDYIELGTSSEALGYLGHMDMLGRFFVNDQNTSDTKRKWGQHGGGAPKWRFKGHAEDGFWRWVCSWARALRRPSDLGCDDSRFVLPSLIEREHLVEARRPRPGLLFDVPPTGLHEEREEQRRTIKERCEKAAELVSLVDGQSISWCHLNPEGDLLEEIIEDSVQVSGSDSVEKKEESLTSFARGEIRRLVIKPKIGAWGLNLQRCAHMTFFPSHSFEQYYQAVRRCWRFGQTRDVVVDIVTTECGKGVHDNLRRKAIQADRMFSSLVSHMNDAMGVSRVRKFEKTMEVPTWMSPSK